MLAAYAASIDPHDPLVGLRVGEIAEADPPEGWVTIAVKAAALNHHDIWSLRGVGLPAERLPMILGCDAAGVDTDGNEVIVHAVVSTPDWRGDETLDPGRSLLSEIHPGTFAERVSVPRRNLVPKPAELSFKEAACLPTAWLTAYRMLFTQARVRPGTTVLVQGAGGGVASAAITLASAAGARVYATSRDAAKRERALVLGATAVLEPGERVSERVDCVIETVGQATWGHSLRALKPGGCLVVSGATTGGDPPAELARVFFLQLRVVGSTMGTREELEQLVRFCTDRGVRPPIADVLPLADARRGLERMLDGKHFGKLVLVP